MARVLSRGALIRAALFSGACALGLAAAPASALAATVTLSADTTITLPSDSSSYTLSSGGTFEELIVSGGTMTFTMTSGESVTITASSQIAFSNDGGFSYSCAANSSIILNPSGNVTVKVSPGGTCSASSGSGVGSAAPATAAAPTPSSSSSSSSAPPAAPSSPAPSGSGLSSAQVNAILNVLMSFNADASVIANVRIALTGAPAGAPAGGTAAFTRDLTVGSTGSDVRALQQYLNSHGHPIAATGPGSTGRETTMFGALTRAALAALQQAASITPALGYFGPKTRAYIELHP